MHHKSFSIFLYEWANVFDDMILKPDSNTGEIWVNVQYIGTHVQKFTYLYQQDYFDDMRFLENNFPELIIKYKK